MEFLNPAAWFGLLALPLLLLPYLIRRKPRREIFSSLLLFVEASERPSGQPWGRINLPWIFFLQLLLLALVIIALSEPVFSVRPTKIAIVIDNSASMQTWENGRSRFAIAQEKARAQATEIGLNGQIDLYLTTPRLERVGSAPRSPTEAVKAITALEAYDLGDPALDYDHALNQLARSQQYERIYLFTDHPSRGHSALVKIVTIGQAQANLALVNFELQRSSLARAQLAATVEATNFSSKDEKVRLVIKNSNNQIVANRELAIGAGKSAIASFEGIPDHHYYLAEIESPDALALDNRRYAVAPITRSLRILGVSPRPQELVSLKAIPGVQIDLIAPSDYEKTNRAGYSLEIFHFATPAELPSGPALFVLPPQISALVDLGVPTSNVNVSNWREAHQLTRYVNFTLFRPPYARPLKPQTPGESIIESAGGPLAFAVERQGRRYLALGFDPFPYLGRENLPMSIFTLNMLDWFLAGRMGNHATGEPIPLGTIQPGDLMLTPKGEKIPLKSGYEYFSGSFFQGIYHHRRSNGEELAVRNLPPSGESDLRTTIPIELRGNMSGSIGDTVKFSFWPYFLLAALLLLLIEWFVNPRMSGSGSKSRSWGFGVRS